MTVKQRYLVPAVLAVFLCVVALATHARRDTSAVIGVPLPEFTQAASDAWINSPPLNVADLRGKVVLLDIWTFECWNCYRSFPWLKGLEAHFANTDFAVVGIHSPEFEHEREVARVRAKVREFGLEHPVMIDNDFAYWRALGNRYWPAYYLVDRQGLVRQVFVGETHEGDSQSRRVRTAIGKLLREPAAADPS